MINGTLYGLGLGPGDPELITVKAWRLMSTVEVIAYPKPPSSDSMARRIAAPFIPDDVIEMAIEIPMRTARKPAAKIYDKAAKDIAKHLDAGRHTAFICNGDPFLYSTFMYLHERLKEKYEIEIVSGVTSLTGCAAAQRRPLASRNDIIKVLPAPLPDEALRAEIASGDCIIINKVGRHFTRIRDIINELGLTGKAQVIENATTDFEVVRPLQRIDEDDQPYFSTIIIYKGSENW